MRRIRPCAYILEMGDLIRALAIKPRKTHVEIVRLAAAKEAFERVFSATPRVLVSRSSRRGNVDIESWV